MFKILDGFMLLSCFWRGLGLGNTHRCGSQSSGGESRQTKQLTTSETTLVSVKSHVFHVQFSIFLSRSVCGKVRRNSGNWRGRLTKAYCSLATDVPVGELAALSCVPCVVLWIDTGIPSCKSSAGFCTTRSRAPSPLRISVLVPKSRPNVTDLIRILLEESTTTTRDPPRSLSSVRNQAPRLLWRRA